KPKQELKISPVKINDDSSFSFFLDSRDPVIYRSYYDFFHTNYSCHFDKDLVDLLKKNKVPNNKKYKITIELIED
ncbi:MAG: hypothetical protein U9N49_01815, partial [Campylobacterota bacterium]|nr:hypothetical protein [Campylobacterota bacterium]